MTQSQRSTVAVDDDDAAGWRSYRAELVKDHGPERGLALFEQMRAETAARFAQADAALRPVREQRERDAEARRAVVSRNAVRRFLNATCADDPSGRVKAGELYAAFRLVADAGLYPSLDVRQFPNAMNDVGIGSKQTKHGRVWLGIREREAGDRALFRLTDFEPELPAPVLGTWRHEIARWADYRRHVEFHAARLRIDEVDRLRYRQATSDVWTDDNDPDGWVSTRLDGIATRMWLTYGGNPPDVWYVNDRQLAELERLQREAESLMGRASVLVSDVEIDFEIIDLPDVPALPPRLSPPAENDAGESDDPLDFVVDLDDYRARRASTPIAALVPARM